MTPAIPDYSTLAPVVRRDSRMWLSSRGAIILLFVFLLLRWTLGAICEIVPDESYYWVWSRHLALSYFDHPPMVAYLIRLGTLIGGTTSIGVRWPMGILGIGIVLILWRSAIQLVGVGKAANFVPITLLVSPLMAVLATIVTPDTPACFFQAAALAVVLEIFSANRTQGFAQAWMLFGLLMGLALISKYTSVLFGFAVLSALLWSAEGRRQLKTPWPWLAAILSVAVFSPVIIWNAQHDWISFRYQLGHGIGNEPQTIAKKASNLFDYLGGQAAVCTPVLFGLCIFVLGHYWKRRNLSAQIKILLLTGTLPLLFFAYSSLHKHVEANWPMSAYLPILLLISVYLSESWSAPRVFWAETAYKVALIATVLVHLPLLVWAVSPSTSSPRWDELFGWDDIANRVQELRQDSPIFATDYHYASELAFYLPDHPDIFPMYREPRPTAYDFFPEHPDYLATHRIVLVRRMNLDPGKTDVPVPDWRFDGFFTGYEYHEFETFHGKRALRKTLITVATK